MRDWNDLRLYLLTCLVLLTVNKNLACEDYCLELYQMSSSWDGSFLTIYLLGFMDKHNEETERQISNCLL